MKRIALSLIAVVGFVAVTNVTFNNDKAADEARAHASHEQCVAGEEHYLLNNVTAIDAWRLERQPGENPRAVLMRAVASQALDDCR